MDRRTSGFFLSLVIASVTGCNAEPGFDRFTSRPARHEVIGTWQALERSLRDLARKTDFPRTNADAHELVLHDSGSCRFRSYWQYSYVDKDDPELASYFDTTNCDWRLGTADTRVGARSFEAPAVWLHVRDNGREARAYFFIARRDDRLVLWQSIGEPDSGYYMDFVQSKNMQLH